VPRTRLPEALSRVAEVAGRHRIPHGNVFHAGDGNLHPLLFFDSRDPDQLQRVHEAAGEIMSACVGLGGTITGEHGVGLEKIEAMHMLFSEDDLAVQRALRQTFDRDDLLNPGKLIPAPGQGRALEEAADPADWKTIGAAGPIPTNAEEVCAVVRQARREDTALLPEGRGRWRGYGNLPARSLVPLPSTGLDAVIEHDPANQVVCVGSGIPLAGLQELVRSAGWWPWGRSVRNGLATVPPAISSWGCASSLEPDP
jgi:FAD/FMN-containing dehydrogenase